SVTGGEYRKSEIREGRTEEVLCIEGARRIAGGGEGQVGEERRAGIRHGVRGNVENRNFREPPEQLRGVRVAPYEQLRVRKDLLNRTGFDPGSGKRWEEGERVSSELGICQDEDSVSEFTLWASRRGSEDREAGCQPNRRPLDEIARGGAIPERREREPRGRSRGHDQEIEISSGGIEPHGPDQQIVEVSKALFGLRQVPLGGHSSSLDPLFEIGAGDRNLEQPESAPLDPPDQDSGRQVLVDEGHETLG